MYKYTFEWYHNGTECGQTIVADDFNSAAEKVKSFVQGKFPGSELPVHIKTERKENNEWIVTFDPFRGII